MDWAAHMRRILVRLGEDATITGVASAVRGLYLDPFKDIDGGMIESSDPRFACMTADISGVAQGTALTVHSTSWTVASMEPDPVNGLTVLSLKRV